MHVGVLGHTAEQLVHRLVHRLQVLGLLALGVGLVGDADHPVERARLPVAERPAGDEPALRRNEVDDTAVRAGSLCSRRCVSSTALAAMRWPSASSAAPETWMCR